MTINFSLTGAQIALTIMYFMIGGLMAFIAFFLSGIQEGMGRAFGYGSASFGTISLILIAVFWPVIAVVMFFCWVWFLVLNN